MRANHVSTYPQMVLPGDSGAPVFENGAAWGIISGRFYWTSNGKNYSDAIYEQSDYIEDSLSVHIDT